MMASRNSRQAPVNRLRISDSLIVFARRHVFLGNKIHPIMQRSDHAQVCGLVIALDFLMTMMPV